MDADLKSLQIDRSKRRPADGRKSTGWILGLVVLLLLGFGAWAFLGARLDTTPVVEVQRVSAVSAASAPNGVVLNATGYIVAAHKIELAAKVVGKVSWIGV